jgi:hypothetical protein
LFRPLLFFFLLFAGSALHAQNTFSAIIKAEAEEEEEDADEEELLAGATARIDTILVAIADTNGLVQLQNIPNGEHTIEFSMFGFLKRN